MQCTVFGSHWEYVCNRITFLVSVVVLGGQQKQEVQLFVVFVVLPLWYLECCLSLVTFKRWLLSSERLPSATGKTSSSHFLRVPRCRKSNCQQDTFTVICLGYQHFVFLPVFFVCFNHLPKERLVLMRIALPCSTYTLLRNKIAFIN